MGEGVVGIVAEDGVEERLGFFGAVVVDEESARTASASECERVVTWKDATSAVKPEFHSE